MRVSVELHCHTEYSPDSLMKVDQLLMTCSRKEIYKVAITDHNTIQGAWLGYQLAPERVIVGEEIMTTQGELLAYFMAEEVPPGLSPEETIARLRAQNAFISVSHPFDRYRKGHWNLPDLRRIVPLIDSIEVFNSRCIHMKDNDKALAFAKEHGLPGLAGSDAHVPLEVGQSTIQVESFSNLAEFRQSLHSLETQTRLSSPWIHLTSRYAKWRKTRINI